MADLALQFAKATGYYFFLILLMRLAGKRLAGQTTTFDLIVLITLGVVAQTTALQKGFWSAAVFILTVFGWHRGLAVLAARNARLRYLLRGKPRVLVREGEVLQEALDDESIGHAELLAGLRKLGFESPREVKLATLEETGHISAVAREESHG